MKILSNSIMENAPKVLSVGGTLTLLLDLAQPIAPFSSYLLVISLLALPVCLIMLSFNLLRKASSLATTFFLSLAALSGSAFALQGAAPSGGDKGFLAATLPPFESLQQALFDIKVSTEGIAENTFRTAESAEQLVNLSQGLKKETSADPRKELANLGIEWSYDAFYSSMVEGDLHAINLFIDSDMRPRDNFIEDLLRDEVWRSMPSETSFDLLRQRELLDIGDLCEPMVSWPIYRSIYSRTQHCISFQNGIGNYVGGCDPIVGARNFRIGFVLNQCGREIISQMEDTAAEVKESGLIYSPESIIAAFKQHPIRED